MLTIKPFLQGLRPIDYVLTLLSPLFMLVETFSEVFILFLLSSIIDKGLLARDFHFILRQGFIMIGFAVIGGVGGVAAAVFSSAAANGFSFSLRNALFSKVLFLKESSVDALTPPAILTRLTTDVQNLQNIYGLLIRVCFRAPLILILSVLMCIRLSPSLSLIFLSIIPILATLIFIVVILSFKKFEVMLSILDKLNKVVLENLSAIRLVKCFNLRREEENKFFSVANALKDAQNSAERYVILLSPVMQLITYIVTVLILFLGGVLILRGSFTVGALISFTSYIHGILMSLMMLGMIFTNLIISRASFCRIQELFNKEVEETTKLSSSSKPSFTSYDLTIKNLSFSYNPEERKNYALNNLSMHFDSGKNYGIIGSVGSGKSTFLHLLFRLYDPPDNSIYIDNQDIKSINLNTFRSIIGIVYQKSVLFTPTLLKTLTWGAEENIDKDKVIKRVKECCATACIDDYIDGLKDKYESAVKIAGVNFSGGQRQRLSIARTLIKSPRILLIDDSFSALDSATQNKVLFSLLKMQGGTKIIVSQKIEIMQQMDYIFVFDNGSLASSGTHSELLSSSSLYQEIYKTQKSTVEFDSPE